MIIDQLPNVMILPHKTYQQFKNYINITSVGSCRPLVTPSAASSQLVCVLLGRVGGILVSPCKTLSG
jgi:hypothetical protein